MTHIKTEITTYVFDQGDGAEMEVSFQRIPNDFPTITVVTRDSAGTKTVGRGKFDQSDLDTFCELAEEWNS